MAAIIDGEDARDTIIEAVARASDGKAMEHQEEVHSKGAQVTLA